MPTDQVPNDPPEPTAEGSRRTLLGGAIRGAMIAGLAAGYGAFASIAARFLYVVTPVKKGWLFVTELRRLKVGDSMTYRTQSGAQAAITRTGPSDDVSSFVALSSVCPHLGCNVHWESEPGRFFCPCHNGTFDVSGRATGGPPFEAGQSLLRYPLRIEDGLLYIEAPLESGPPEKRGSRKTGRGQGA